LCTPLSFKGRLHDLPTPLFLLAQKPFSCFQAHIKTWNKTPFVFYWSLFGKQTHMKINFDIGYVALFPKQSSRINGCILL
jgi:hypothetical protein